MMQSRDLKIDGVKVALIFFVVLSHMKYDACVLGAQEDVTRVIAAFNMPAFIFLSGFFSSNSVNFSKFSHWMLRMIVIYFLAQWAQCLFGVIVHFVANGRVQGVEWSVVFGLYPCFALWYLLSLIWWRLGLLIFGGKVRDDVLIGIVFLLSIFSGYVPLGHELSFQRTFAFAPMFVLGWLFKKNNLMVKLKDIAGVLQWKRLLLVFLSCCVIAYFILPTYKPDSAYSTPFHDALIRGGGGGILGALMSLTFICLLYSVSVERISKFGCYTLWVYIGHTIPIIVQNYLIKSNQIPFPFLVAVALSALYVLVLGLVGHLCVDRRKVWR